MSVKKKAVSNYIKERHTQEECTGFIDGYEQAESNFVKSSYYILALGIILGVLICASLT